MSADAAAALKKATQVVDALAAHPHQKGSCWPLEEFLPLARDYLRLMDDLCGEYGRPIPEGIRESGPSHG